MDFFKPEETKISGEPPADALTLGQNPGPERMLGPILLTPVTRMSFLQFSMVSWVHRWPWTHQSHGKVEEAQEVQEVKVLQSKKVKLVSAKLEPSSSTRTDSLLMKWDSPLRMLGSRSFLTKITKVKKECAKKLQVGDMREIRLHWDLYLGVVQCTPWGVFVAFVISTCSDVDNQVTKNKRKGVGGTFGRAQE